LLKVVHIDTGMEMRGGQEQMLRLARKLRERGCEQLLVCPEGSAIERRASQESFRIFALPSHDIAHAHGILQLRERLRAERFDILHAHDGRGHTLGWLATLGMPIPRLATRRVIFLPSPLATRLLRYEVSCHAIIAISQSIQQLLVSSGVPESKIEVIPDGIEVPLELPGPEARSRVRAGWGFSAAEFAVGHVGAFTPEKGQDVAMEAIALSAVKLPQARLLLAGAGPTQASLEKLAERNRVRDRVRLPGYIENLTEFFAGLDLFIMPSRAEGLGSSVLLAMAHGLAVVASRVGGLPEIVQEGETGWLVPPASPAALAEAIATAASDRVRLTQLGANARARARQFSTDIMVNRTQALYERVLAQPKRVKGCGFR